MRALVLGILVGVGLVWAWELGRWCEHRAMINRMDSWSGV